uniref:Mediator of rna polymerase ii transcription subunit 26 n=1 Tax=Macrostomum lignano TaxID=282301 RepID=A0A1I8GHA2_9PLAT
SSSSSNSTSDSSSSDSDPHVNNRCLWRKSRVSNSNLSNSNSSNAAPSDSGSSRSSQLDTGELDNNQLAAEESNSSLPARRPVFRAQDKVAPSKKPDSTALPAISGRGTKLNVSEFEADPNQSVHLGHVYQSVEQLEPSGAVRILDPRQMLADLDGGWPTDQLQSAPSNCEVSSDSVAFKPEVSSATASSRLHKSIQFSTSATAQPKSSSTTYSPQSNYRQPRHQLAQCDQKNPDPNQPRERREEALAKPRNTSADPAKLHDKRDERGRTRSQLMQQSDKKWIDIELPGVFDRPKVLKKSELPVDEVAKRIVAHRLSRSTYLDSSQSGRTDARSPALNKPKRENKDFDESSTNSSMDSDDLDFQRRRFTSGHHGRISVTNFKAHQLPQQKDAKRSPTDSDWHNRNSSNRARRLNQHRQLEVTELKLAMHSTEPHFYSDSREPCTGVCGASFVPVSRRCRQAVLVQSQAVHSDLQLRRVQVNPRARRKKSLPPVGKRQTQAPGDQSSDLSNNNSSSGGASDRGDARWNHQKILPSCPTGSEYYKGLVSMLQQDKHLLIRKKMVRLIKTHCSQHREEPATIGHWLRLGSLPEPQKPAVAKVKRVHHADSNPCRCSRRWQNSQRRRPTEQRILNLNCLNWNVSHCTETVENPSLMSVSDTEQQLTQSRQTALLSSWIEADRNDVTSTVTAKLNQLRAV